MAETEQQSIDTRDSAEEAINVEDDEQVLDFLDSLDRYLLLHQSFSSALRQGWLELARARHSMGPLRMSSVLLDHNVQSAATTLRIAEVANSSLSDRQQAFTLAKWSSSTEAKSVEEAGSPKNTNDSQLRHRGQTGLADMGKESSSAGSVSPVLENNVQKERSKALSLFGGLVSPKLRAAQFSFETALDVIVEIANARAMLLSAHSQLEAARKTSG